MKLILVAEGVEQVLHDIILVNGFTPSMCTFTEDEEKDFAIPDIEPALWFKALVLSSVTVNCVERQVTWTTKAGEASAPGRTDSMGSLTNIAEDSTNTGTFSLKNLTDRFKRKISSRRANPKRLSESMFAHSDGAGQNADLEEVFTVVIDMLYKYEDEDISKLEFYIEMFRVLHCYILPSITFTKEDIPELQAALDFQDAIIQKQDQIISSKDKECEQLRMAQNKQREKYGGEIQASKSSSALNYPHPLAIVLLNHFQEDLQELSTVLAGAQTDVNILKGEMKRLDSSYVDNANSVKRFDRSYLDKSVLFVDGQVAPVVLCVKQEKVPGQGNTQTVTVKDNLDTTTKTVLLVDGQVAPVVHRVKQGKIPEQVNTQTVTVKDNTVHAMPKNESVLAVFENYHSKLETSISEVGSILSDKITNPPNTQLDSGVSENSEPLVMAAASKDTLVVKDKNTNDAPDIDSSKKTDTTGNTSSEKAELTSNVPGTSTSTYNDNDIQIVGPITLNEASIEDVKTDLKIKREIRDGIFEQYKKVLHIREILSEYVSDRVLIKSNTKTRVTKRQIIRSKLKLKGKKTVENPLHKIYMGMVEHTEEKNAELQKLIEDKLKILSVKEGIKGAIKDLQTANTSYGVQFDNFGSLRATDVMTRPGLPTNWQTIEEQVKQMVDNENGVIGLFHSRGCERIITECQLLHKFHNRYLESESDAKVHKGSPDTISLTTSMDSMGTVFVDDHYHADDSLSTSTESSALLRHSQQKKRMNNNSVPKSELNHSVDGGSSTYVLHVPFGGMCIPLRNPVSKDNNNITNGNHYFDESQNFDRSSCGSLVVFEEEEESDGSVEDLVIIHDVSPDYARKAVEKLVTKIKQHIHEIIVKIQQILDRHGNLNYQKIWTCYERIFFTVVYPSLECIYKQAYMDILHGLKTSVPLLTPYALDIMDTNLVVQLFTDVEDEYYDKDDNSCCDDTVVGVTAEDSDSHSKSSENETDSDRNSGENQIDLNIDSDVAHNINQNHIAQNVSVRKLPETSVGCPLLRSYRHLSEPVLVDKLDGNKLGVEIRIGKREKSMHRETVILETDNEEVFLPDRDTESEHDSAIIIGQPLDANTSLTPNQSDLDDRESLLGRSSHDSSANIDMAEHLIANLSSSSGGKSNQTAANTLLGRSKYTDVLVKINLERARQLQKPVHIYYPVSTHVHLGASNRNTWPLVVDGERLELGQDALTESIPTQEDFMEMWRSQERISSITTCEEESVNKLKSIKMKPEYLEKLQVVVKALQEMCDEITPTEKLKKGFLALKQLEQQVTSIGNQINSKGASTDELTDFQVVLFCNIDIKLLMDLYLCVQMMRDLMGEFFETGPYGFAVMQLTVGLHFLQERIVMQRRLIHNDMARQNFVV